MYLSRLRLRGTRLAADWSSNPYRVHQRIKQACAGDPRVLFRIEEKPEGDVQILVQSHLAPNWDAAFADLPVLRQPPEFKPFDPHLAAGRQYRFRLRANPTAVKTSEKDNGDKKKPRLGLLREDDQRAWLKNKLEAAGAELLGCIVNSRGMQHSFKTPHPNPSPEIGGGAGGEGKQTHLAVLFEGVLLARDPDRLVAALEAGIGPAKGFGFGLLSLAPA